MPDSIDRTIRGHRKPEVDVLVTFWFLFRYQGRELGRGRVHVRRPPEPPGAVPIRSLPIVPVVAYYHGDRGQQRITTAEFHCDPEQAVAARERGT